MAHVESVPMLVNLCQYCDGLAVVRWRAYHAYTFDMEFILYEMFDAVPTGLYRVFFCGHNLMRGVDMEEHERAIGGLD